MTLGEKIAKLRRANNFTQEQLAAILGVTRQSISKWESDLAYPETEKLIRMGEMFDCSMDYLLKEDVTEAEGSIKTERKLQPLFGITIMERKSDRQLCGLPLYHIGKNAKGFIAVGLRARGVISIGLFSAGVLSFGLLSIGILAFGALALGLMALGTIAVGLIAVGAVSLGIVSIGAAAIGCFSGGAAAVGRYAAIGDTARGLLALGKTSANGGVYEAVGEFADRKLFFEMLEVHTPHWLAWAKSIFIAIFR